MKKFLMKIGLPMLIIAIIAFLAFEYFSVRESGILGGTLEKSEVIKVEGSGALVLDLSIKVNNEKSDNPLNIEIINPKEEICDNFKVDGHQNKEYDNLKFKGTKGEWKIKFTKEKEDDMSYEYGIKYVFKNRP